MSFAGRFQEFIQKGVDMMKPFNKSYKGRSKIIFAGVAISLGLLLIQSSVSADELPTFRHGLWMFHRTMAGKSMEARKCMDPSGDILQKGGCKFSSVKKSGNTYTFTADCPEVAPSIPELGGRITGVLTAVSDAFYKLELEGQRNGQPVKEFFDARRIGDCPK